MNAACCCIGTGGIDCAQWVTCRPLEIWIDYAFTAEYRQTAVPQAGAIGAGGILYRVVESCSGSVKFRRVNSSDYPAGFYPFIGGPLSGWTMQDYAGSYSYLQTQTANRFLTTADGLGPFCPSLCTTCLAIVPSATATISSSRTWANSPTAGPYATQAFMYCNRCVQPSGQPSGANTALWFDQGGNYTYNQTNYRCNGSVQSSATNTFARYSPVWVYGQSGCLRGTTFDSYYIQRTASSNPSLPYTFLVPYPPCISYPFPCTTAGAPAQYESDSVSDCYDDRCVNRACFDPALYFGCGCDTVLDCANPFPPSGSNACYQLQHSYVMNSTVSVTNVIP